MSLLLARSPRLLPAPDPNPPYDDLDAVDAAPSRAPRGQGELALEFAGAIESVPSSGAHLGVEMRCRALARALAEALSGSRPLAQLRFGVTGNVHRRLTVAARAANGPYAVSTVHVHPVTAAAVEVTATLHGVGHAHAMALRLEVRHGRWLCTALEVGTLHGPRRAPDPAPASAHGHDLRR